MKNVWLAQPTEKKTNSSIYLPYAIGALAAYSWQFPHIKAHYALKDFIIFMDDAHTVCERLDAPYIVAFSCYLWNINYNLLLAQKIKEKYPDCIIVFGGPDVPENDTFLKQYSFIDMLIFGEGEEPFYQLLCALEQGGDLSAVTSIAYRTGDKTVLNPIVTPKDISNYPSPYLEGYFDAIIYDPKNRNLQFDMVLETNRGCPYRCAYCSWGMKNAPVRIFNMNRVKGEIRWMVEHRIAFCFLADGNFGILKRDKEIADYILELKKGSDYPQSIEIFTAKNQYDLAFDINQKLNAAGLIRGVDLACQSLSPVVLKNIGRQNLSLERFAEEVRRYREADIFTYSDLILGLPGETYESFCENIFHMYEAGQHYIMVFMCELLPCSQLAQPDMMEKFSIRTMKSNLCQIHTSIYDDQSNKSRSEIIIETYSMTKEDWLNMNVVAGLAQAFHGFGLTRFVANYLRRAQGISYHDFYMGLFDYIRFENAFTKKTIDYTTSTLQTFIEGKSNVFFFDKRFGDIFLELYEAIFACIATQYEEFFAQIKQYLTRYFEDKELFEDLMLYQISKISFPYVRAHHERFLYDWEDFFGDIYNTTPKQAFKKNNEIAFKNEYFDDLEVYTRDVLWVGKRKGKTYVKSKVVKGE